LPGKGGREHSRRESALGATILGEARGKGGKRVTNKTAVPPDGAQRQKFVTGKGL